MLCIDFYVIFKFCVKQLTNFERTVVAALDSKNCTMVNCDYYLTHRVNCLLYHFQIGETFVIHLFETNLLASFWQFILLSII